MSRDWEVVSKESQPKHLTDSQSRIDVLNIEFLLEAGALDLYQNNQKRLGYSNLFELYEGVIFACGKRGSVKRVTFETLKQQNYSFTDVRYREEIRGLASFQITGRFIK